MKKYIENPGTVQFGSPLPYVSFLLLLIFKFMWCLFSVVYVLERKLSTAIIIAFRKILYVMNVLNCGTQYDEYELLPPCSNNGAKHCRERRCSDKHDYSKVKTT